MSDGCDGIYASKYRVRPAVVGRERVDTGIGMGMGIVHWALGMVWTRHGEHSVGRWDGGVRGNVGNGMAADYLLLLMTTRIQVPVTRTQYENQTPK
jgi:hypothetical protein